MLRAMQNHLFVITGSSRGLGAALVAQCLQPGQVLLGIARQQNAALQARADAAGVRLEQWPADLADAAPVAHNLAAWLARFDPSTLASATLINNAGMMCTPAPLDRVPLAEICQGLRVGLEAAMLLSAVFLDATRAWPGPRRLLNISSGLGRHAMAGSAVYSAAKAGIDHFSRVLALEQSALPNPARVVSMGPGLINTDMQAAMRASDAALFPERARFVKMQADGLLVSPEDCAIRLLARLARADFGQQAVADIHEA